MDEDLRELERAWLASPDDIQAEERYRAAIERAGAGHEVFLETWRMAGQPGRDPRRHPLPGDVVEAAVTSRWSRGNNWNERRRYLVVAVQPKDDAGKVRVRRRLLGRTPPTLWLTRHEPEPYVEEQAAPTDAGFRMLESAELAQAMGFDDEILISSWRAFARDGEVLRRVPMPSSNPPRVLLDDYGEDFDDFVTVVQQLLGDRLGFKGAAKAKIQRTPLPIRMRPLSDFLPQAQREARGGWWDERGDEYMEDMRRAIANGVRLPPVVSRGGFLVDGFHRVLAYADLGLTEIETFDLGEWAEVAMS